MGDVVCPIQPAVFRPQLWSDLYLHFVPPINHLGRLPLAVAFNSLMFTTYEDHPPIYVIGRLSAQSYPADTTPAAGDLARIKYRIHSTADSMDAFILVPINKVDGPVYWGTHSDDAKGLKCEMLQSTHRCNLTEAGVLFADQKPIELWVFFVPHVETVGVLGAVVTFRAKYFQDLEDIPDLLVLGRFSVVSAAASTSTAWPLAFDNTTLKFTVRSTGQSLGMEVVRVPSSQVSGNVWWSPTGETWMPCSDFGTDYRCVVDTRFAPQSQNFSMDLWITAVPFNQTIGLWNADFVFTATNFSETVHSPFVFVVGKLAITASHTPTSPAPTDRVRVAMAVSSTGPSKGSERIVVQADRVSEAGAVRWGLQDDEKLAWPCANPTTTTGSYICELNKRSVTFGLQAVGLYIWFTPSPTAVGDLGRFASVTSHYCRTAAIPTNVTVIGTLDVTSTPGPVMVGDLVHTHSVVTASGNTTQGERVIVRTTELEDGVVRWSTQSNIQNSVECFGIGLYTECTLLNVHFSTVPTDLHFWFTPRHTMVGPRDGVRFMYSALGLTTNFHTPAFAIGNFNLSNIAFNPLPAAGESVWISFLVHSTGTRSTAAKAFAPATHVSGPMKWGLTMDPVVMETCPIFNNMLLCDLKEVTFVHTQDIPMYSALTTQSTWGRAQV
eukprot:NODE_20_length_3591_cov_82.969226_g18_i0.p1 GENE.NODE_20_length_3591_cov_82.969226_g18_i0~~NODE_20_length_3591_cov_82.969226_g18_i0.p1  ORF type:complete len:665 (-),score=172.13 NODE_20_length_3591_cov_82.969226_g18_i0:1566-3560(-)